MNGEGLAGVGLRLRAAREAKGYSRAELARRTGVGEKTITKAEGRASAPESDTLLVLARALDQDPWFLVFGEAMPPKSADAGDDLAATVSRLDRAATENREALARLSERQQASIGEVSRRLAELTKIVDELRRPKRKVG